jgi:tRNA(adenine34) deaminase
MFFQWIS